MQYKHLSVLFWAAAIFTMSCGNGSQQANGGSTTQPVAAGNCATSAQLQQVPIQFGDPGGDTSSAGVGGCTNPGICVVGSTSTVNPLPVPVDFNYVQGNPSTLTMSFMYQSLLTNQQSAALFFYNNAPVATYQFGHNFDLSTLGGAFANVCGTINATPAGAGVITYSPILSQQNPPPNAQMNSQVIVTFTVTP